MIYPPFINYSNYVWQVDDSPHPRQPGPTRFSTNNAIVKPDGLHLLLNKVKSRWYGAEIYTDTTFGYGKYTFEISSPLNLDKSVVLGLFTWNDAPAYANREIDIEVARWGYASDPTNAQFVVQPYNTKSLKRITISGPITVSFDWHPTFVDFSAGGQTWHYTGKIPPPPASVHMNLWVDRLHYPKLPVEIIIKSFSYVPNL